MEISFIEESEVLDSEVEQELTKNTDASNKIKNKDLRKQLGIKTKYKSLKQKYDAYTILQLLIIALSVVMPLIVLFIDGIHLYIKFVSISILVFVFIYEVIIFMMRRKNASIGNLKPTGFYGLIAFVITTLLAIVIMYIGDMPITIIPNTKEVLETLEHYEQLSQEELEEYKKTYPLFFLLMDDFSDEYSQEEAISEGIRHSELYSMMASKSAIAIMFFPLIGILAEVLYSQDYYRAKYHNLEKLKLDAKRNNIIKKIIETIIKQNGGIKNTSKIEIFYNRLETTDISNQKSTFKYENDFNLLELIAIGEQLKEDLIEIFAKQETIVLSVDEGPYYSYILNLE